MVEPVKGALDIPYVQYCRTANEFDILRRGN